MKMNRRKFLKIAGLAGGSALIVDPKKAFAKKENISPEFYGMLIDTTLCIGCRSCESACNEVNNLPKPKTPFDDYSVFEKQRTTDIDAYTVVNQYSNTKNPSAPIFRRIQCMHCNQPACASACLVKAMQKQKEGPITYNSKKCMGCRYCMISCPFDVPKFEYDKAVPSIRKCIFCYGRLKEGKIPACAEACPTGATLFGKRKELLEIAKTRIYQNPDQYVHHIYGEDEVGGTGWLYLSSVPFEQIGLRTDLGTTPYPEYTKSFLYGVALVFLFWPAMLTGISHLKKREEEVKEKEKIGG